MPIVRRRILNRYGAPLRRRLNAASQLLSTLELRGLNEEVIDGRLPEAVGGEFADANGLGGPAAVQMMSLSALGLVLLVISTHPGFLRLKVNLEEHADAPVVVD